MNDRTREGFYTLWTIAILICLAVCVFLLAYVSVKGGGEPAADAALPPADGQVQTDGQVPADGQAPADGQVLTNGQAQTQEQAPVQEQIPVNNPTVLAETLDLGQEYQDKLVFLGDSTTYGFRAYDVLPRTQVWTPASGTLALFNWEVETIEYYAPDSPDTAQTLSIADTAAARKPEYLVITLGVNGVSSLGETEFKGYYRDLVQAIQAASPGTRIMCQSIYPVIDGMAPEGITNASINSANQWIQAVAAETGTRYLNTHDSLTDDTGNLISSYNSGDGLHLTPDGLRAILAYVRSHAYQ